MEGGRIDVECSTGGTQANGTKESVVQKFSQDNECNRSEQNSNDSKTSDMVKRNEESELNDGAHEKMLNDESKIMPQVKESEEVKFISENGDAKIDIEMVKKPLSGLCKEELMKYANDPFWIRLRWFLFIGFWILWAAMLAGSIAIIVMAPKCSSLEPKKLWEESPIMQLDADDIKDKDADDIAILLDDLNEQHVKILSLSNFVDVDGHTVDFRDVQPKVGTIEKFDNIIKLAEKRGQRIVLELDPNHSSIKHPWFDRSVKREDPYTNYYVWADGKSVTNEAHVPPNNWLSINGGSAWEWNAERGQFYLHQFNKSQPDLNFNNPAVVAEFGEILSHWLQRGISGFRLGKTQYLTEDPNLRDESHGTLPSNQDEYQYLNHVYTYDRTENGEILRQWREIVANRTNGNGLFALRENISPDVLAIYNEKQTLVDLPQGSIFSEASDSTITGKILLNEVSQWIDTSGGWPSWNLNSNGRSLKQRMPRDIADSLMLMTLLLPGTPILKFNDTLSAKDAFTKIAKSRQGQTFLYGGIETKLLNGTVFAYTRLKSGNPGYLVAYQSSEEAAEVDFSSIKGIPTEINVFAHSPNYSTNGDEIKEKLFSNRVHISPKSTLIMTFVPNE